ncbi:hypothetical protein ACIRPQ_17635 [Streptomyces sp. NPDC101213]|uniref:hypothetical protein n=1 Tax=Streptomyces sp. NPDC101213 TaxID=3366130 RepID=UPI00381827DC
MSEQENPPAEPPVTTAASTETPAPTETPASMETPVSSDAPVSPATPASSDASVSPGTPVPAETLASPEASASPDPGASVPAGRRPNGRRVALATGALLLAGAVVAGVGTTVVIVRDADRDAGAPGWKFPAVTADEPEAARGQGLAGMLLPYGGTEGWTRGPDLDEFGSDVQLSGAQATALRKKSLSDLPRSQRLRLEKQIDKQRIQGMAMRSYYNRPADTYSSNEDVYSVSVVLSQLDSKAAVREIATFQSDFLDALDIFRKGPEIKGHKNAKCFLPPKDDDSGLSAMYCSAYVGNVLVSATAQGVEPIDTKDVAAFLRAQLDRVAKPGEAV